MPYCNCLAAAFRVDEITLKFGSKMFWSGKPQVGVLNRLNVSKRNSKRYRSVMGNCLNSEKSRFLKLSPRSALRPRSPYDPSAVGGIEKAFGLSQAAGPLLEAYNGWPLTTFNRS